MIILRTVPSMMWLTIATQKQHSREDWTDRTEPDRPKGFSLIELGDHKVNPNCNLITSMVRVLQSGEVGKVNKPLLWLEIVENTDN